MFEHSHHFLNPFRFWRHFKMLKNHHSTGGGLRNVLHVPTVLPPDRMKRQKGVQQKTNGSDFRSSGSQSFFLSCEKHNHHFCGFPRFHAARRQDGWNGQNVAKTPPADSPCTQHVIHSDRVTHFHNVGVLYLR
jgi:hypothetical protein